MVKSLRLFKEEDGRDSRGSRGSRDNSETEYHNFVRDLAVVSFVSVVSVVLKLPHYPSTTTPISCQKGSYLFYRKRRSPRDSTRSTARGVLLLGWGKDVASYHEKLIS